MRPRPHGAPGAGDIVNPKQPLALRLSGHLLLGVVRYYSRKVYFLFTECNDAMSKLKMVRRGRRGADPTISLTASSRPRP